MTTPDPTNVRNRIEKYTKDKDLQMLFKAVYLLGAMECEMLGATKYNCESKTHVYGPTGNDDWEKTVEVNGNKINTVSFVIKTAKTKEKEEREVWLPMDCEPWVKEVYEYFKEKGNEPVFPFDRQKIYTRVKKSHLKQEAYRRL